MNKTYTITLTEDEVQAVGCAIMKAKRELPADRHDFHAEDLRNRLTNVYVKLDTVECDQIKSRR
jgi:hypothetical protein